MKSDGPVQESMPTEFSIIVPSHNGSDTLEPCLEALGNLVMPEASVEVLLVDNASYDATPAILADHAKRHGWQVLSEQRRGKSYALNTAIEAASGRFLVFMDDDIIPDRRWLKAFFEVSRKQPEVGVFAGQIRPNWPGDVPSWLQRMADEGRACGCTAVDWKAGPYPAVHVKGGNVMFRRSAIGNLRFDTITSNFDGSAKAVGGEDTKFVTEVEETGAKIVFVPDARAEHILQPDEVRFSALFRRQMRNGRSGASAGGFTLLDKILTFPAIGAYALAVVGLVLIGKRDHAMKQLFKIAMRLGRIDQWFLGRG